MTEENTSFLEPRDWPSNWRTVCQHRVTKTLKHLLLCDPVAEVYNPKTASFCSVDKGEPIPTISSIADKLLKTPKDLLVLGDGCEDFIYRSEDDRWRVEECSNEIVVIRHSGVLFDIPGSYIEADDTYVFQKDCLFLLREVFEKGQTALYKVRYMGKLPENRAYFVKN